MNVRAFPAVLVLAALSSILVVPAGHAQARARPAESGIWIADASGSYRQVDPASESFLQRRTSRSSQGVQIVFAVERFAESATGAIAAGEFAAALIASAVAGSGVAVSDISTELAHVGPRFERRLLLATWEQPRRLGYDVTHLVTVRTSHTARLGLLIDAATGAGATRVLELEPEGRGPRP